MMASREEASGKKTTLKQVFNKVNHIRHVLMDVSMIGMAVGAFVATGGAIGFFDPLLSWAQMHVSGIPDLLTSAPDFLGNAFEQAQDGVWFTGNEASMSHADHHAPTPDIPHDNTVASHHNHPDPSANDTLAPDNHHTETLSAEQSIFNHAAYQTPMEWFSTLPGEEMLLRINEANAVGIPFEDYIAAWCENNHIDFI